MVTRSLAACVDFAVVLLVAALLDLGAAGVRFVWSPRTFRWPELHLAVTVPVVMVVGVLYLTVGWAMAGRTYGARLLGLRVLSSRHELLGWTVSTLRAVTCVVWPVGLLWCVVSPTRRSVADVLFRTVVFYDAQPYAPVRRPEPASAAQRAS